MAESWIEALLGQNAAGLASDTSLAPALTLPRITGREEVNDALEAYAQALGAVEAETVLGDGRLDAAIFTGNVEGHTTQTLLIAERDNEGLIARVDMYGRPWPYMALVRDRLKRSHPELTDARLDDVPYVPEGPGDGRIDAPQLPAFADDVAFYSPFLTAVPVGPEISQRILATAGDIYGEQMFRAVLQAQGRAAVAGAFDGKVDGHTLQLVALFGLNQDSDIDEIRIFSRPWPITHQFRVQMYERLKDTLGPEYWHGPDPQAPIDQ
jgi:hypothetical protein